MRKNILILSLFMGILGSLSAQKFAIVDMEYILKNIPSFETANEQLNIISKRWQSEVEAKCRKFKICIKTTKQNWYFFRMK